VLLLLQGLARTLILLLLTMTLAPLGPDLGAAGPLAAPLVLVMVVAVRQA
jgi:hypothetical protein